MKEFTRGAMFTVGLYVFGKGMYKLGEKQAYIKVNKIIDEVAKDFKKKEPK